MCWFVLFSSAIFSTSYESFGWFHTFCRILIVNRVSFPQFPFLMFAIQSYYRSIICVISIVIDFANFRFLGICYSESVTNFSFFIFLITTGQLFFPTFLYLLRTPHTDFIARGMTEKLFAFVLASLLDTSNL